jgi:hypothetical protein
VSGLWYVRSRVHTTFSSTNWTRTCLFLDSEYSITANPIPEVPEKTTQDCETCGATPLANRKPSALVPRSIMERILFALTAYVFVTAMIIMAAWDWTLMSWKKQAYLSIALGIPLALMRCLWVRYEAVEQLRPQVAVSCIVWLVVAGVVVLVAQRRVKKREVRDVERV